MPLWFWNNTTVNAKDVSEQLKNMMEVDMYGGCSILPFGTAFRPDYLGEEYFQLYGEAIRTAKELGGQMSLYDEYGFPSGSMGCINGNGVSRFMNNHPGKTIKRLDKQEYTATPARKFTLDLTKLEGKTMAVVGYNPLKQSSMSLRDCVQDGKLTWTAPSGSGQWKVMVFQCVSSGDPNVDYLDADAVRLFVEDTHEQYYKRFPEAFGTTITSTFFDEPTLYRADGRIWTDCFNERFQQLHGFAPDSLYPALWYNLGENTAAARNLLFGTRAVLYAEGFMKTIADWAEAHHIKSTGHQDQEEIVNPTAVAGDLMLDGKYMTMPGIDKIGGGRPTEDFYKVVSSSANNWDHEQVMSETYGDMGNISIDLMYQIAIEQYTKGINNLIPHAVWYNDRNVTFLPELSWRNSIYNTKLRAFNNFLARLKYMLCRPGQHVADIAMLYPIETLQGGHYMDGALGYYQGGVAIKDADYNVISRLLTDELGRDFTYLHPEVLNDRCSVGEGGVMTMQNPINTEHFTTLILPSVKVINIANLRQIEKAWEQGATVIFTTQTPSQSADFKATNEEIQAIVSRMLENKDGKGKALLVPTPDKESLAKALENSTATPDVLMQGGDHALNYIHKVVDGKHVYYFGNIDGTMTTTKIVLGRDIQHAMLMNPHTGKSTEATLTHSGGKTELELTLFPAESVFLVESDAVEENGQSETEETKGLTYTIEMKVRVDKLSAGVIFAAQDTENYYMYQINLEQPNNPRLRPHEWRGGGVSVLADFGFGHLVKPRTGQAFKLKIEVINGRQALTYINDVLIDKRNGDFDYGMIGFREDHSDALGSIEAASFDDILITYQDGKVLYSQNFTGPLMFTQGTHKAGWLYVAGSMTRASYAWPKEWQTPTSIQPVCWEPQHSIYNLHGMTVQHPLPGEIYLINGKKTYVR